MHMVSASGRPATAQGQLEKTPMVHLLVYLADRRLTGSISFFPPCPTGPAEDVIHFLDGAPAKVRTAVPIAHLGEVLVDLGLLTEEARSTSLEAATSAGELHGNYLVRTGMIDRTALFMGLRAQAKRKTAHIFSAPTETKYSFFEGTNLLEDWGGPELSPLDPLDEIWLAASAPCNARLIDATLARLGSTMLKLHPSSPVERFGFGPKELRVVKRIRAAPATLSDVIASQVAPDSTVRLVVYVLLVTRHLDHGSSAGPVALDWVPVSFSHGSRAPASASVPAAPAKSVAPQITKAAADTVSASGHTPLSPALAARREAIVERAKAIDNEDYFQMLDVRRDATDRDIQTSFLTFAKVWHSDRLPAELDDVREQATKVFARTNTAFETLSKPERRRQYLDTLAGNAPAADDEAEQVQKVLEAAMQYQHAEVFFKKHDLVNAEQCIERACSLDPEQSGYLALNVAIQFKKRSLDASVDDLVQMLDAVIAKNDRCELAYFTRANMLKRLGETAMAMDDFRIVYALNPGNLDAAREVRIYEMRQSKLPGARGSSGPPEKSHSSLPAKTPSVAAAKSHSSSPATSPSSSPATSPSSSPGKTVGKILSGFFKLNK
jgi:tetratricopeptide (TPR) repeat protein